MAKQNNNGEAKAETAKKEDVGLINQDDLQDLHEVFLLARGNSVAIKNEATMANLINYKSNLFARIENTIKKLEDTK